MKYDIYSECLISVSETDILRSFLGIFLESSYTPFDLGYDIPYPVKIYSRCLKLVFRLILSALIKHYSCGFLKYLSSVLRPCAYYIGDLALADYRVAFYSDARIHEKLADISEPALVAVNEIFALSGTEHASCDCYFVIFKRQDPVRIVYHERDFSHALRFSGSCSGKNNILHLGTAKLSGALLSEHPSERV